MYPCRFTEIVAFLAMQVFAAAQLAGAADLSESYVASGPNGLKMQLRLLKPLAEFPTSGWLNSAEGVAADGEFGGRVDRPLKMVTKAGPIVMVREKRGTISAGSYKVDGGILTVCMLSLAGGSYRNATEMAAPENYVLCAQMKRK
jgi:hypothetical protein